MWSHHRCSIDAEQLLHAEVARKKKQSTALLEGRSSLQYGEAFAYLPTMSSHSDYDMDSCGTTRTTEYPVLFAELSPLSRPSRIRHYIASSISAYAVACD